MNEGARSYKGEVIGDSMAITINIKWLAQIGVLIGMLVYGYYQIESRITNLENEMSEANGEISSLLEKHMIEEKIQREQLEEKVAWYEKNINPLSWGKKKKK